MSGEEYKGKSGKEELLFAEGTDFKNSSTLLCSDKSCDNGNTFVVTEKKQNVKDLTATPTGSKVDGSSQLTRISDDSIVFTDDSRKSPIM